MRLISRTHRLVVVCLAVCCGLGMAASARAAEDPCSGYPMKERVTRFGGPAAFGKPVKDVAGLQEAMTAHEAEFRQVLADRGLGAYADGLFQAIRDGEVRERQLSRGERLEWMAYRKGGKPATFGPFCIDTRTIYGAYEVTVNREEMTAPAAPSCGFRATRDCQGRVEVDASGASPGVAVTLDGQTIVSGDSASRTWSGVDPDLNRDLTVRATASVTGSKMVSSATFLIPKICLNLALVGESHPVPQEAEGESCAEERVLEVCEVPPACELTVSAAQADRNEPVEVAISHTGTEPVEVKLELFRLRKGGRQPVAEPAIQAPESTLTFKRRGEYHVVGTVSNAHGTATCEETIVVGPGEYAQWTVRPYVARIDPDDDVFETGFTTPDGVREAERFGTEPGPGVGVLAERHFNERVGLLFGLLWGQLDSSYLLDLGEDWERDTDDLGILSLDLGLAFHLTPESRVDLFLGPLVSYVQFDDGNYTALGRSFGTDFDSDLALGAILGMDVPFKPDGPWGLFAGVRYLDLSAEDGQSDFELGLDPLIFSLGLAYDF